MKKNDIILAAVLLFLAAAAYIGYRMAYPGDGRVVRITIDGEEYASFPLDEDAVVEIPGRTGVNVLEIKDGNADMLSAGCPDQICVDHIKIHFNRESIICLPGKIIVEIVGGKDSELDAAGK